MERHILIFRQKNSCSSEHGKLCFGAPEMIRASQNNLPLAWRLGTGSTPKSLRLKAEKEKQRNGKMNAVISTWYMQFWMDSDKLWNHISYNKLQQSSIMSSDTPFDLNISAMFRFISCSFGREKSILLNQSMALWISCRPLSSLTSIPARGEQSLWRTRK